MIDDRPERERDGETAPVDPNTETEAQEQPPLRPANGGPLITAQEPGPADDENPYPLPESGPSTQTGDVNNPDTNP